MSIKVYHGAPGSYKTSSAVQDDLIPILLESDRLRVLILAMMLMRWVVEEYKTEFRKVPE